MTLIPTKDYRSLRNTNSTFSDDDLTFDLKMRTPAEAQSFVGTNNQAHKPNLPSKVWKHSNDALIKESVSYKTKVSV